MLHWRWMAILGSAALLLAPPAAPGQQSVTTIGALDGADEYIFGWIAEVEAGSGGLFVLDSQRSSIRWYGMDGRYRGVLGRGGQGPGEFRRPSDVAVDDAGNVHVLDPGNMRISVFSVSDDVVRHLTDQRTPPQSVRLCAAGGRRFLLTTTSTHLFVEIDDAGEPIRTFGAPVTPDARLMAEFRGAPYGYHMNPGPVYCEGESRRLLYASLWTGHVRLYDLDGRSLWQTDLPGFRRVMMRYSPGAGTCCLMGIDPEIGSYDQIIAAVLSGSEVVISLRVRSRESSLTTYTHKTCSLEASTGRFIACSPSPHIVAHRAALGSEIRYTNHPLPQITITDGAR